MWVGKFVHPLQGQEGPELPMTGLAFLLTPEMDSAQVPSGFAWASFLGLPGDQADS